MTPRGVDGALVPYDSATMAYNFAPLNYYQRADKRYSGGVFAHLDMSDRATTYAEFQFMDDTSDAQIAPSGAFRDQAVRSRTARGASTATTLS